MAEAMISEDVYGRLREFLDHLPAGYPETESGVELKILRKLFTPEEAEMAMQLRQFPEPPSVIARRIGKPEAEVAEMLASMARKGLILSIKTGKHLFYQALHFIVGIYEFHLDSIDRELAELMEDYIDNFRDAAVAQLRVVPVNTALDAAPAVAAYDRARELVRKHKLAAVAPCICRKERGLMGEECEKPHETCLSFGVGAQYYINNDKGREISIDEALRIMDMAEEAGLVLMPTNSRDIVNICCCCGCCCGVLRVLKMQEIPADHVRTSFQAVVDRDLCTLCETCLDRCPMEAIAEVDGAMEVDLSRCIGCGLCVSTCPEKAISLVPRADVPAVPTNYFDAMTTLSRDRGQGFGKLNPIMKMSRVNLMVKSLPFLYKSGLGRPMADLMARRGWI